VISALLVFGALGLLLGAGLAWAAVRFRANENTLVNDINAVLPQTQCGQCNFPGCKPYARAIAEGRADINQCRRAAMRASGH